MRDPSGPPYSLNYGDNTNLSLIIVKFRDYTSMNSTENIPEGYRNGLSETAVELKNCKQQLFTLTMCYQHACELKLPRPRLITRSQLRRFLQNVMIIDFSY